MLARVSKKWEARFFSMSQKSKIQLQSLDSSLQVKNHPLPKTAKFTNEINGAQFVMKDILVVNNGLTQATYYITPFFVYSIVQERISGTKHLQVDKRP